MYTINDFIARVSQWEEKQGKREIQIARDLGLPQSTYRSFKAGGERGPALITVLRMMEAIGAETVYWMLTGQELGPEASEGHQPPARDWIALPDHDPTPLEEEERSLLQETALILRCPRGTPNPPSEGLKPLIKTLAGTTAQLIEVERHKKKSRLG